MDCKAKDDDGSARSFNVIENMEKAKETESSIIIRNDKDATPCSPC